MANKCNHSLFCANDTCYYFLLTDRIAQAVTCLAADTCPTADAGVASSIPTRSHTLVEIDHEVISTAILLHSADSRRFVVSYKRKNVSTAQSSFPTKRRC